VRERLQARSPLVALGAAVALVTGYVLTLALDSTAYLNDEYGTVIAGRGMARDPSEIFTAEAAGLFRGVERLTSVVLAAPDALFSSGADQLRAGHVVLALAWALTAVPAYALLRGLEVPRWPAVGVAVCTILGPWIVFGTTFLNVTLAVPLTLVFVWASWRALVRPSLRAELVAIAALALMTIARSSHAVFFGGVVVAAVLAAWWSRPDGMRLGALPARVVRRTPVIVAVALVGLALVVVVGPDSLAGKAYENAATVRFPWDRILTSLGWTTAVVLVASGFVALPVGGAWALRQVVRPTDVGAGVFAVLAISAFLLFAYIAGAAGAEQQERYPSALGALPLIALGAAVFRRETWVLGTAVVGLLGARALAVHATQQQVEPLSYVFSPAELLFSKVVVGRLTTVLPGDEHMVGVAAVLVALVAVAVALAAARAAWARTAVVGGLLLGGVVGGVYTMDKYEPATRPGDLDALAWLDTAAGGDDAVFWNYQWPAVGADRDVRTRETLYRNATACCTELRPDPSLFLRPGGRIERDPLPPVIAGHDGYRPVVFAAREVVRPVLPDGVTMRVERFVSSPGRAAAVVRGAEPDGGLVLERPARIVALPALEGGCLDAQVSVRPDAAEPVRFSVGEERAALAPGATRFFRVRGTSAVRYRGTPTGQVVLGEIHLAGCDEPVGVAP
jgi:hypothetical protein